MKTKLRPPRQFVVHNKTDAVKTIVGRMLRRSLLRSTIVVWPHYFDRDHGYYRSAVITADAKTGLRLESFLSDKPFRAALVAGLTAQPHLVVIDVDDEDGARGKATAGGAGWPEAAAQAVWACWPEAAAQFAQLVRERRSQ